MITFRKKGNFSKVTHFFERAKESVHLGILDRYGRAGVEALSSATPRETGKTADSWYYTIEHGQGSAKLIFNNSNINSNIKYKETKR